MRRWMPASTSSTPPTSTPGVSRRRSSARPWPGGATRWCWPPSSASRWAATPTGRGVAALDRPGGRGQPAPPGHRVHRPLPAAPARYSTDLDETLGALSDLVRAGKVRAIGSSTFPAELIVEAQWVAERRGHHRFRTEQPRYSILTRTIEGDRAPDRPAHGMGVLTYGPLSSGWLSGRADPTRATGRPRRPRPSTWTVPANRAKLEAVGAAHRPGRRGRAAADPPGHRLRPAPTRPSPRSSSGRGRPPSSRTCWPGPTSTWATTCSTASTRSCRRVGAQPDDDYLASSPALADPRPRRR